MLYTFGILVDAYDKVKIKNAEDVIEFMLSFMHGSGFLRNHRGNYYFGTWTKHTLDRDYKVYLAWSNRPSLAKWGSHESHNDKVDVPGRISHKSISLEENWSLNHYVSSCNMSCLSSSTCDEFQIEVQDNGRLVYEKEYMQGVLIRERIMNSGGPHKSSKHRCKIKEAKTKLPMDKCEGHKSSYFRGKWSFVTDILRCRISNTFKKMEDNYRLPSKISPDEELQ